MSNDWRDEFPQWKPDATGSSRLGPQAPGQKPWETPEWPNMSIEDRKSAYGDYNAAAERGNVRDAYAWLNTLMGQGGENVAMFDNEVMSRFMNMPRYDMNEEKRGVDQGFYGALGNMGSVSKTLRGLAPGVGTQEAAEMSGVGDLAGKRGAAYGDLYNKQQAADMQWLNNLTNLFSQRMNVQGVGMDRIMALVNQLENVKLNS